MDPIDHTVEDSEYFTKVDWRSIDIFVVLNF